MEYRRFINGEDEHKGLYTPRWVETGEESIGELAFEADGVPSQMVVGRVRITKVSVKTTATNFIIFGFRQDIKFDILNILVSSFFFSFG
jgi:hypothetical protein